jgi:hypothetical protein
MIAPFAAFHYAIIIDYIDADIISADTPLLAITPDTPLADATLLMPTEPFR